MDYNEKMNTTQTLPVSRNLSSLSDDALLDTYAQSYGRLLDAAQIVAMTKDPIVERGVWSVLGGAMGAIALGATAASHGVSVGDLGAPLILGVVAAGASTVGILGDVLSIQRNRQNDLKRENSAKEDLRAIESEAFKRPELSDRVFDRRQEVDRQRALENENKKRASFHVGGAS